MSQGALERRRSETGRRHVATLMKKMGIKAITAARTPRNQRQGNTKAGSHRPNQGVGNGPDLHPHGAGICSSVRRRGLVQPEGLVMAVVDHDGSSLLHRGGGGGTCSSRQAEIFNTDRGSQFTSIDFTAVLKRVTDCHLDGWQGCVARQCLRRAALAFDQIRGSHLHAYKTVSEARAGIARYLNFYNTRRPHWHFLQKLAMRQPFVLFKGLVFKNSAYRRAFRPWDHHNKMLRPAFA